MEVQKKSNPFQYLSDLKSSGVQRINTIWNEEDPTEMGKREAVWMYFSVCAHAHICACVVADVPGVVIMHAQSTIWVGCIYVRGWLGSTLSQCWKVCDVHEAENHSTAQTLSNIHCQSASS